MDKTKKEMKKEGFAIIHDSSEINYLLEIMGYYQDGDYITGIACKYTSIGNLIHVYITITPLRYSDESIFHPFQWAIKNGFVLSK